jgi:hypothetical protein
VKKVEQLSINETQMILVQLVFKPDKDLITTVKLQFDPSVNYLIRKAAYDTSSSNGNYRREEEVVDFKECEPGVFYPERVLGRSEEDGKPYSTSESRLSDIHVNEAIPKSIFHLTYPNGVYLSDGIKGTRYRVDAQGNQISEGIPLTRGPAAPIPGDRPPAGSETQAEPGSAMRWILPISLLVLAMASVAGLLRRRRERITEGQKRGACESA